MGLVDVAGVKKKKMERGEGGRQPSWVLSAAVDVRARMQEGDGQQPHPPLP